jgi:ubiquitin-like modifier-activating enzyme 5
MPSQSQTFAPLLALKQLGIIHSEKQLSTKTAILLGTNQIGSEVAEVLVKCGLGKLIFFDYEKDKNTSEKQKLETLRDKLL